MDGGDVALIGQNKLTLQKQTDQFKNLDMENMLDSPFCYRERNRASGSSSNGAVWQQ